MNKWIGRLFVVVLALSFSACGDKQGSQPEEGDKKSTTQESDKQNRGEQQSDKPGSKDPGAQADRQPQIDDSPQNDTQPRNVGGQDETDSAELPQSRVFSSLGRALFKGSMSGAADPPEDEGPIDEN